MTAKDAHSQADGDTEGNELFPGPTRRLYIIRHGQYASSGPPDFDGPLTAMGRVQAELVAERLAGLPIQVIHSSTLQRAQETARIVAERFPGVETRYSPLLCECIASVPAFVKGYLEERVSPQELIDGPVQARSAWEMFFQPPEDGAEDESQIIVSSGNLIGYLVGQALGAPADAWIRCDIQHCGLTEITIKRSRGPVLLRHNDTGHLPSELRTFV